jgi:tetratricopeptide (TPR) repeat protein
MKSNQAQLQQVSQLLSQGSAEKAEQLLEIILKEESSNEEAQALLGHSLMMQGKNNAAILVFTQLTKLQPKSANAYSELASALLRTGKAEQAEQAFRKAVQLDPHYSDAWHFLGNLLMQKNSFEEGRYCFKQSERFDPFKVYFDDIKRLLQNKKFHDAEKMARGVLKQHPNHPQALHVLAQLAEQSNAFEQGVNILTTALKYSPYHVSLWELISKLYAHLGLFDKSIEAAEHVVKYNDNNVNAYMLLKTQLANAGKFEQSLVTLDKAIALTPDDASMYIQRGHVLRTLGQRQACEEAYKTSLTLDKVNGTAYWALADLKSYRFSQNEQKDIYSLFHDEKAPKAQVAQAGFAIAKHWEDSGDFDQAFSYYQSSNTLRPNTDYQATHYQQSCNSVQQGFDEATLSSQATSPKNNKVTPIFIVGLTRSGSTLIEQILASHSQVEGTMELYSLPRVVRKIELLAKKRGSNYPQIMSSLTPQELASFGQLYLDETAIFRTDKPYFIDKMPRNFHHVGLIKMILPDAIIIDARRHPLSTGFSNYKQHFARGHDFSYSLEHIGHYYNCYLSLMDYWDNVLPNKVLRVQYENMVKNTEAQIKILLKHCGLEFEQPCIDFHQNKRAVRTASSEQVRQPINNKGMQQWLNFEKHLTPLKEALGDETLKRFEQWL